MAPNAPGNSGRVEEAISAAIATLHCRYYGKQPREAKTYLHDECAFCVLKGPFTTVEETLIEAGAQQSVRQTRQSFQSAMTAKFSEAVAEATGREVTAFVSQVHVGPDFAVEVFKFADPSDEPI